MNSTNFKNQNSNVYVILLSVRCCKKIATSWAPNWEISAISWKIARGCYPRPNLIFLRVAIYQIESTWGHTMDRLQEEETESTQFTAGTFWNLFQFHFSLLRTTTTLLMANIPELFKNQQLLIAQLVILCRKQSQRNLHQVATVSKQQFTFLHF